MNGPRVAMEGALQQEYVIETTDLTKRYGDVLAVDRLSLRVPHGGVFGFLDGRDLGTRR